MTGTIVTLVILLWISIGINVWLIRGNWNMAEAVERLQSEVEENGSVIDSTIIVLNGLANRLREALMAEDTLDQVSSLADELDANSQRLAAAVAANTLSENDSEDFDTSDLDGADVGESGEESSESSSTDSTDMVSAVDVETEFESAGDNGPAAADDGSEEQTPPAA